MGEAANLNGDGANQANTDHESASEIREDIEDTRERLSATIDAIQDKLNPEKIKAEVAENVREATIGKAKEIVHALTDKAHELQEKVAEAAAPVIESVQTNIEHVQAKLHHNEGDGTVDAKLTSVLKPLNEQVVVIFGASSGIGRETALQFARRGAKVVVASRGQAGLDSLVEEIETAGGEALAVTANAADFNQVQNLAEKAVLRFGRIDTWVQTAAISIYAKFEDTTPEEFRQVLEVNLLGQMHGALAALPHLRKEGRGALIHVSSVESQVSLPLQSAYAASKHGMAGFLDSLRMELEDEGVPIFVTDVKPAGINTPLFDHARTKLGVKPQPTPPIYEPGVVAEVILHAAEHPTREITAGGAAQAFIFSRRISPALTDGLLRRMAIKGQQTDKPKPAGAPDNMFSPLDEPGQTRGDFGASAKDHSMGNKLETNPMVRRAIKGAALAAAFLLIVRAGSRR